MRLLALACPLLSLALAACSDSTSSADAGAGGGSDASAVRADASAQDAGGGGNPDAAAMGNPDASAMGNPDAAAMGNPDAAAMGNPDASAMGNPDALTGRDAAVGPANCQATMTGAVTGTFSCVVVIGYVTADDSTGVAINATAAPMGTSNVSGGATISGRPMARRYAAGDLQDFAFVVQAGAAIYAANDSNGTGELTLSAVTSMNVVPDGELYTGSGSFHYVLENVSGGSGTITIDGTF